MRNKLWQRSGFGALILYVVSALSLWCFDGQEPGSMEIITATSMALALLGYQVRRPSKPA